MSLIVIFSDGATPKQRASAVRVLQRYGCCVALSEASYAIHTDLPPQRLLRELLDGVSLLEQRVEVVAVKRRNPTIEESPTSPAWISTALSGAAEYVRK